MAPMSAFTWVGSGRLLGACLPIFLRFRMDMGFGLAFVVDEDGKQPSRVRIGILIILPLELNTSSQITIICPERQILLGLPKDGSPRFV